MDTKPTNDRGAAVTKFCVAMEEHRRTPEGRVRTAKDLLAHFFPYTEERATDRLFHYMPNEVRGPILASWGIRGMKAALRDDDVKVRTVVFDALVAGDIDDDAFEKGISPQTLVDWVPLTEWWKFWRTGKLTGVAIQKALATARGLGLIDDKWFFENLEGRGGKLKGTDAVCDTLSKDQIVAWLRNVHASGDGSPAGLVAAIGWETILNKTAEDALLFALDAFAKKAGLVAADDAARASQRPAAASPPSVTGPKPEPAPPTRNGAAPTPPRAEAQVEPSASGGAAPASANAAQEPADVPPERLSVDIIPIDDDEQPPATPAVATPAVASTDKAKLSPPSVPPSARKVPVPSGR